MLTGGIERREEDVMVRSSSFVRCFLRSSACLVVGLLIIGVSPVAAKEKKHVTERFQANAMDLDTGRASLVSIGIFEWSTNEERQALIQAFTEDGNEGAYEHLGKQDEKAFVKLPNTMGYQMRYAYQFESEGKRYVILGTDRPIGMGEVMRNTDSQDANISFVTLQLDAKTGKGTGKMVFGAEFKINKKTGQLEIETVSMNPTKLTAVKTEKVKDKN